MNNSQYFSTQPSANAVPASQVMAMMPPQQGHMVAAGGQPMMVPAAYQQQMMMGQQPVMMMPAQQSMYAPAQQQMMVPVQQQVQAALPKNVQPKLAHAPVQRQFTVTGVENPHLLEVEAPNLSWQMTKQGSKAYAYSYAPAGKIHEVSVKYNGGHVEGSPFQLVPKEMRNVVMNANVVKQKSAAASAEDVSVELHPTNKHHLVASNVPNVDKLQFKTKMAYKLLSDSSKNDTFHLQFDPRGGVHRLDVSYDGKPVRNGQFEFVPKKLKAQHRAEQNMARAKLNYEQSVAALDHLQLKAPLEQEEQQQQQEEEEQAAQRRPVMVRESKPADREEEEEELDDETAKQQLKYREGTLDGVPGDIPEDTMHLMQAAPKAYAPMVMASHQPMMVPQQVQAQQQQQPMMMMAPQPMMQPMSYGNMTPPMYRMVPQQQVMQQQQQPRMYQQ